MCSFQTFIHCGEFGDMKGKVFLFFWCIFLLAAYLHTYAWIDIPDIQFTFQQPTYLLEKDIIQDTYTCDSSKDECKVNLDLSSTFGWSIPSSMACSIDFWFITWEEEKCNPWTVTFPEGEFSVHIKVYEKDFPENLKEKQILIKNIPEIVDIPDPYLEVQSWLISTENGGYICTSPESCSVNLTAENSFWENSKSWISCLWDFGGGVFETFWTEQNCNPWFVKYGYGDFLVKLTLFEAEHPENKKETNLSIYNQKKEIIVPEPNIEVQSGVEWDGEKYVCTSSGCKVNLTVENSFSEEFPSSLFVCQWDFGSGSFETVGTDTKCNPWFVTFPYGVHDVSIQISEKGNEENKTQKTLSFSYGSKDSQEENDQSSQTGEIVSEIPNLVLTLQSPSYISETFSGSREYICDTSKDECKVNFSLEETFWGYIPTKYACKSDFWFITGEEEKCNPATIIFPIWEYHITFRMYEKDNVENEKIVSLHFINTWKKISSWGGSTSTQIQTEEIDTREIILQSWGSLENKKIACSEEQCKINITFQKKSHETCSWDFWGIPVNEKYLTTCNPWFLYYPSGIYHISLIVFDSKKETSKQHIISLENTYLTQIQKDNIAPTAKITLQWKVSKNKELRWNTLYCFDEECSINVSGEESSDINGQKLEYFWDFGNGETSQKQNPSSLKYSPGKYRIILRVFDGFVSDTDTFLVEVLKKWEIPSYLLDTNISKYLRISSFLPNPISTDTDEWIEIENTWFTLLNLKWVVLDDAIGEGSKPFQFSDDEYLFPYGKKKLYKYDTKLNLENDGDEVHILYNGQVIDSLSRNFKVKENFVLSRQNLLIESQEVEVIEVIDGDTLKIRFSDGKEEKIRLIWVDTPETKHPKKVVEFFGIEAYNFTKSQLEKKKVWLEIEKENYRDKYWRLLGYIRFSQNETSFNEILIEKWYARAYLFFPFKYADTFEKAQSKAKKEKVGMWADTELIKELKVIWEETVEEIPEEMMLKNPFENFQVWYEQFQTYLDSPRLSQMFFTYMQGMKNPSKISWEEKSMIFKTSQEKNFSFKVSLLKSWLKVSGKTFPNEPLVIHLGDKDIFLTTDTNGVFTYLETELEIGDITVSFSKIENGKRKKLEKEKVVSITQEYYQALAVKKEKELLKAQKKKEKSSKKTKKKSTKKKKVKTPKPKVLAYSTSLSKNFENDLDITKKSLNHEKILLYIFLTLWWFIWFSFFLPYNIINLSPKR